MHEISEDVLDAARRGDGDAFGVLWRTLSPAVHSYLRVRGVADAEAVTSDVFVTLLPKLAEVRGGVAGLRTFVFSVAHARVVDEARRRSRRPEHLEFDQRLHDEQADSAESEALARLSSADVTAWLERLAPDHREVLALRVVADLSLEETATVMRRSIGSVKQLQRRALLALRAELTGSRRVTRGATETITGAS